MSTARPAPYGRPSAAHAPAPGATPIPLLDVQRQYQAIQNQIATEVLRVCESGRWIMGPDCQQCEKRIAEVCQTQHAVACASGSDALLLALMAYGIGPGDEVILPSYTFFATAGAVARLGAKPVFVDIEASSFNLDPARLAERITAATKAVIPVHLFGQCADMQAIRRVVPRDIPLIEDAAQAIGAEFDGRRAGSLGAIGCLSFYPTKNLGCFGDGGMLTTNDSRLADTLRLLCAHGMQPRYYHKVVGINSRLDTLQAAILNVKLPHLEDWTERRIANAAHYAELFAEYGLQKVLTLPSVESGRRHVWNQYTIRIPNGRRDALRQHLSSLRIGTEIYYPVPLHLQECFRHLGYGSGSFPESERAAAESLALPIYSELTEEEQSTVVRSIAAFYGAQRSTAPRVPAPAFLNRAASAARESKRTG